MVLVIDFGKASRLRRKVVLIEAASSRAGLYEHSCGHQGV